MFKVSWPEALTKVVQSAVGTSINDLPFAKVAASVLKVSDLFIAGENAKESKTPWNDPDLRRAYLSYFFPLNTLRVMRVLDEAKNRGFLDDIDHVIDIGSGPGTVELAFKLALSNANANARMRFENYEPFREAQKLHSAWKSDAEFVGQLKNFPEGNKAMYVLSYSLNEISEWPVVLDSAEALMIIEPSTRDHGRRLMELRQQLIDKGFSIWAPCTHKQACPLLTKTKTDWCHHRFSVDKPEWFSKLESQLPMKNDSLTVSYLLARKKLPATFSGLTRVIGDTLFEKGKVRQMICRRDEREFLSYLTRQGDVNGKEWEGFPNGSIVELPTTVVTKGAELRIDKADLEKLVPSP